MLTAEELVAGVRAALAGAGTVREVKMFGGVGFMLNGHLIAGASGRGLLVRVGKERQAEALARADAQLVQMRGRKFEGYIRVGSVALSPRLVKSWIRLALPYINSLPPKARRARPARSRRSTRKGS